MSDGTDWCIHYTGIINDTCEAGVVYADVKDETRKQHYRYPCFKRASGVPCPKRQFLTEVEAKEHKAQSEAQVARYLENMANDICPWCEQPVDRKVQVGRCVYAEPCGHRLYQGKLEAA